MLTGVLLSCVYLLGWVGHVLYRHIFGEGAIERLRLERDEAVATMTSYYDRIQKLEVANRALLHQLNSPAADTRRLDAVAAEYLHLVPFDMPTGAGDADVGWDVLQSTTGYPDPALLGRVFEDDPRKAIDAAIANNFRAANADGTAPTFPSTPD